MGATTRELFAGAPESACDPFLGEVFASEDAPKVSLDIFFSVLVNPPYPPTNA
jgi:hypothetical protein